MNQQEFDKQHPGLKQEMMMEEAIASAELAGATLCQDCGTPISQEEAKESGLCSQCLRSLKSL